MPAFSPGGIVSHILFPGSSLRWLGKPWCGSSVESIDEKLTVAVTFLTDPCKADEAMAYIDRLLDARLIIAGLVPCPSLPT